MVYAACILLFSVFLLIHNESSTVQFFFGYFYIDAARGATQNLPMFSFVVILAIQILVNRLREEKPYFKRLVISLFIISLVSFSVYLSVNKDSFVIRENGEFARMLWGDLGFNHGSLSYLNDCMENNPKIQPFRNNSEYSFSTDFTARGCMAEHLEANREEGNLTTTTEFLQYCSLLPDKTLNVSVGDIFAEVITTLDITYFDMCIKEYFWTIEMRDGTNLLSDNSKEIFPEVKRICRVYEEDKLVGGYEGCMDVFVKARYIKPASLQ